MKIIPIPELTDEQWAQAHEAFFSLKNARRMGTDPNLMPPTPTLLQFYSQIMDRVEAGTFMGWAAIEGDKYVGHAVLDKTSGEWEFGVMIQDETKINSGLGARLTLKALRELFENTDAQWAMAFINATDPNVKTMAVRFGFRPFLHFYLLSRCMWNFKWGTRRTGGN